MAQRQRDRSPHPPPPDRERRRGEVRSPVLVELDEALLVPGSIIQIPGNLIQADAPADLRRVEVHPPVYVDVDDDSFGPDSVLQIPTHLLPEDAEARPHEAVASLPGVSEGSRRVLAIVTSRPQPRIRLPGHINHSIQRTPPTPYELTRSLLQNTVSSSSSSSDDEEDDDDVADQQPQRNTRESRMRRIRRIVNEHESSTTDRSTEEDN
ncbi:uncharacterized protein LOC129960860 [Argiope bruennichi]|uniref:Uncharacterized protein n=1 Tax=Argiope bruennichi TaxID=94029 RepID=A0A8T0FN93_ARGBR|nr:uncharacterized protein LOC129960860 [Argiope bruennichi]XP_055930541.1 uncharacterized protein LOC129960860 [Argiope bruennichi]KAF8790243.1 hypothetical protein HNY73_005300 [Argiope bruennichi]